MKETKVPEQKSLISESLSKVFAHIAANEDAFVSRVMDYVRHPSISAHNIGIHTVAALLVSTLNSLGF
jgi:hypothetical protein